MEGINSKLKDILDKYDQRIESKNEAENKQLSENNEFLNDFEKLCTEIIRPSMEEIGVLLNERGHGYKIDTKKGNGVRSSNDTDSFISMKIYPYPYKRNEFCHDTPSISFHTSVFKKEIYVAECNMMPGKGGSSGRIGSSYNIDDIKPEFIQETILSLLKKIL